jgi:hypothetical protein
MVDKALFNPFSIFIRKIGFSVGLEHTLDRLRDFASLYAGQNTISYADVRRLLHGAKPHGWGLDRNNEHVLDVLRSFEVVSVRYGEVGVLEVGDALGILRRLQPNDEFELSLRLIFADALVRADGDIFLNALAAYFDPSEFRKRIHHLLEYKWSVLENYFRTAEQRSAIYQAVNIEVQDNNPGSRGRPSLSSGALGPSPFAMRGKLLQSNITRPEPQLSEAYLTKALPRRKAWAVSLGLATSEGAQTAVGTAFLQHLIAGGMGGPSCVAVWPLSHELVTPKFAGVKLADSVTILSFWEYLSLVGQALGLIKGIDDWTTQGHDRAIVTLKSLFQTYQSLNLSKSILRVELPARVAYRCALALAINDSYVAPYPSVIEEERTRATPRLLVRPSRLAEFALSA